MKTSTYKTILRSLFLVVYNTRFFPERVRFLFLKYAVRFGIKTAVSATEISAPVRTKLSRNAYFIRGLVHELASEESVSAMFMKKMFGRARYIRVPFFGVRLVPRAATMRMATGFSMVVVSVFGITMNPLMSSFASADNSPTGTYTASGGRDSADTTTWTYTVTEIDRANGISHISLQTCFTANELTGGVLVDTDPSGAQVGFDGATGFGDVIKWDFSFNAPATISVTLDDTYAIDPDGAKVIIKYGDNFVAVSVPGPDCAPPPPPPGECKLVIGKSVDKTTAYVGDVLTYTLTFKNEGTADCTGGGVKVTDVLSPGLTYQSSTMSGNVNGGYGSTPLYQSSNRTLTWNANVLEPNESGWVSWKASVADMNSCGQIDIPNTGKITSAEYSNFSVWVESNTVHTTAIEECPPPPPQLIVIKHVINDNGGQKQASDFTINVTGGNTSPATFLGNENGVTVTLDAGAYSVNEIMVGGYAKTLSADCIGTIVAGQTKTCIITNNDIAPKLTVTKVVINNDGGTKQISDFPLSVGAQAVTSGAQNTFNAGTHTVSEIQDPDYAATFTGDCDGNGVVVLNPGDVKECTITNNDIPHNPTLRVIKVVINDDGGTKQISNFALFVDSTQVTSGQVLTLQPGTYNVHETQVAGYAATITGDCDAQGNVTLAFNESKTCVITNNDIAPKLTVTKIVINDNGGQKQVVDFDLLVGMTPVVSGIENSFAAADYVVSEVQLFGYNATIGGDCDAQGNITLALGETKQCTITNNDIPPTLTVTKVVINDDGGTKQISDFALFIGALQVASGDTTTVQAGTYTVGELSLQGYSASLGGDCNSAGVVAVDIGEAKQCTITNNDVPPPPPDTATLRVIKVVINDNGGTKQISDFALFVDSTQVTSGQALTLSPGTYNVHETQLSGYAAAMSGDCDVNGDVGLVANDNKTCTITNDDAAPPPPDTYSISGVKFRDDNANSVKEAGEALLPNWTITLTGTNTNTSVVTDSLGAYSFSGLAAGTYAVCEQGQGNWVQTYPGGNGCHSVVVTNANIGDKDFGNRFISPPPPPPATYFVSGVKFNDANANGVKNSGEALLSGWEIRITGGTNVNAITTTNAQGAYMFAGLQGGTYTVCEVNQTGWNRTYPVTTSGCHVLIITNAGIANVDFGNTQTVQPPVLVINKNVSVVFTNPNAEVTYTISVRNAGTGTAFAVKVHDTLPAGITEKGTGKTSLDWNAGDLAPGQEWTIAFTALVAPSALAGIYKNVASAQASNYGVVQDDADVEIRTGSVLGFTTLPPTGGNEVVQLYLLLLVLCAGILLIFYPKNVFSRFAGQIYAR